MPATPFSGQPAAGAPVAPASLDELTDSVRACAAAREPLLCEGNGTKRHHGPAASGPVRRLSMRRLAGVTSHDPADMVVSVLAGTRLADLQRVLAEHRQWLPLDPPYANATIGGILATASAGPRRLGYGTMKDLLLGLRLVGPGGTVTRSGGRVVKNVSGFDLHRLQVGAMGSLGVILEAHLRVSGVPARAGTLLVGHDSLGDAFKCLLEVRSSLLRPVALEAIDRGAATALRPSVPELPNTAAVAIVGFEGSEAGFERHRRDLAAWRTRPALSVLLEDGAAQRLWQGYRDAPARAAEQVVVRVAARPQALPALLESFDIAAGVSALFAHAGNGIARLHLDRGATVAELAPRLGDWDAKARAVQGYALVESAPLGMAGRERLPFGTVPHTLGQRLKAAWDPDGLMNPGRLPL